MSTKLSVALLSCMQWGLEEENNEENDDED